MKPEVREARRMGRGMIAVSIGLAPMVGFLEVAKPGFSGGPMMYESPWYVAAVPWLAITLYLVGLAWMIRIHRRSHLEPETSFWRYRA